MAYELTTADLVWNRATEGGGDSPASGDQALASLLYAHGLVMNGGVFHAVELLNADELQDAQNGYRFFGLDEAADLLARAVAIMEEDDELDEWESRLDREYLTLAADSMLNDHFKARFQTNPEDFSPVER